jgi:hypothetical protein
MKLEKIKIPIYETKIIGFDYFLKRNFVHTKIVGFKTKYKLTLTF